MNKNDILTMFDYNYWANPRILDAAEKLTVAEYTTQVAGISHGSARATLVHGLLAEQIWRLRCFEGVSPTTFLSEDDVPTLAELRELWATEEALMRAGLDQLTDESFQEDVTFTTTGGRRFSQPLGAILTHVVNHGTQHRAEAAVILTAFGHSPGDVDLTIYLRSSS